MRWIMHVDMDAFFAAIEQLDNPELRGKPVIIGGGSDRGVVSTASYEARKFGVRSAMSVVLARKLCPQGIFVSSHFGRYAEVSRQVHGVLMDFSPLVEMASVDEAYLDATGLERLFGPVEEMAQRIQAAVVRATGGLSCSVGIAPIKFLAKIASDMRKPGGIYKIDHADMAEFLQGLEVGKIPGVGKAFVKALAGVGVKSCADVQRFPEEFWERRFGKMGLVLWQRARGVDEREVKPWRESKSESAETTFEKDTRDMEFLKSWLLRHAERVGKSLRKHGYAGRVVTLKVKYASFHQVTRQMQLPARSNNTKELYEAGCALLDKLAQEGLPDKVRLIGLGVSGFQGDKPQQLSLFAKPEDRAQKERQASLDKAMDALRERYGHKALIRGRLFGEDWQPGPREDDKGKV